MPRQQRYLLLALFLLSAPLLLACGGGESRPGPLDHHLDEMYIARVPIGEKQMILQAQNDYNIARMERANAEAAYNESATELEVARNERSQAELAASSAESRKNAADESGDMTRMNSAAQDLRAAKLEQRAANKKVQYMEARRTYLRRKLFQAEDEMYAQEARFELSKARLAHSKNIRPKGFSLANFEAQAKDRARHAQRTAMELQKARSQVESLRKEWRGLVQEATRARNPAPASGGMGSSSASQDLGDAPNPP